MIRGLAWFDTATETFSSYHRDVAEPRSLPDDYVVSLFEDRGGSLWIGTKTGGLAKWNPRTWSFGHATRERRGRLHRSQHHLVHRRPDGPAVDRHLRQRHQRAGPLRRRRSARCARSTVCAVRSATTASWRCSKATTAPCGSARWAAASIVSTRQTLRAEIFQHDPAVPTTLAASGVMSLLEVDRQVWVGTYGGGISRFDDALAPLRQPAPRPRRRPAPDERPRDGAGARPDGPRLDRHRRRRAQRLGLQDAPALLLQARREAGSTR